MKLSIFYEHIDEAARQRGVTVAEICRAVRDFGYTGVELDAKRLETEGDALLSTLFDAGLAVSCVYYFFDFGASADCAAADEAEARRILALCAGARTPMLLAVPGFLREDEMVRGSERYLLRRGRMAQSLERLVELARAAGITVVMEDFDGESAPFATADELLWFMENVPGMRCAFDTGNFLFSEESAQDVLEGFLPYLSGVHCKDRSFEQNDGEPKITVQGRAMYPVAVGDGCIDIAGMIARILDTGYTGGFSAEHFGAADQLAAMERSAQFLKRTLGA